MIAALAVAGASTAQSPQAPEATSGNAYVDCAHAPDVADCLVRAAAERGGLEEVGSSDLVAAGAVAAARARAAPDHRRLVESAARVARGERPAVTPGEAQMILALFVQPDFIDSGLSVNGRASWLWPVAMSAPAASLEIRADLLQAAAEAGRLHDVRRLIAEAPINGRWTSDQRALFASRAAAAGGDPVAAKAWLNSGGARASGYDVGSIRLEIDRARLRSGYDARAAAHVAEALLTSEDVLSMFADRDVRILRESGATAEAARAGAALLGRARNVRRSAEERTSDYALASKLFDAAGDRTQALAAAREGAALTPATVRERLAGPNDRSSLTPSEAAAEANGFGTEPVRQLYRLGARDEALANGHLAGLDRYRDELESGRPVDPAWIAARNIGFQLRVVTPAFDQLGRAADAAALLRRVTEDPAAYADAGAEEVMMLAAVAGDRAQVERSLFRRLRELDSEAQEAAPGGTAGDAVRLAITWRAVQARLAAGSRTGDGRPDGRSHVCGRANNQHTADRC